MKPLTPKQEAFAQYVADGLTQTEAYRRAYNWKGCKRRVGTKSSLVKATPAVLARIEELRKENAAVQGLSRAEKRRILAQQARDRDLAPEHRRQAIQVDNLMTGDNKPVKVEGEITLGSILLEIAPSFGLPAEDKRKP